MSHLNKDKNSKKHGLGSKADMAERNTTKPGNLHGGQESVKPVAVSNNETYSEMHGEENIGDELLDDGFDDLFAKIDENRIEKQNTMDKRPNATTKINSFETDLTTEESFFLSPDPNQSETVSTRHFPGPAGVLSDPHKPEQKPENSASNPMYRKLSKMNSGASQPIALWHVPSASERMLGCDETLPSKANWKKMIEYFKLNIKDTNDFINSLNVKWLREKAKDHLKELKMPFLTVVSQGTLEKNSAKLKSKIKNPSVKLMDPTGTIIAAFNQNFVDAYGDKIIPGTALALRNCRVVHIGKEVILTVTKSNLFYLVTTAQVNERQTGFDKSQPVLDGKWKKKLFEVQNGPLPREEIFQEYQNILSAPTTPLVVNASLNEVTTIVSQTVTDLTDNAGAVPCSHTTSNQSENNEPKKRIQETRVDNEYTSKTDGTYTNSQTNELKNSTNPESEVPFTFPETDDDDEVLLNALDAVEFIIAEDFV